MLYDTYRRYLTAHEQTINTTYNSPSHTWVVGVVHRGIDGATGVVVHAVAVVAQRGGGQPDGRQAAGGGARQAGRHAVR